MKVLDLDGLCHYNDNLLNTVTNMIDESANEVTTNTQTKLDEKANINHTHDYIPMTGSTGITGSLRVTGELQSTNSNGLRIAYGNYGTVLRNDGNATYVLITNENDPYGSWSNLRPLTINNSTGLVSFDNGLKGNLTGNITGNAASSNISNAISSTGFGNTSFTYYQSGEEFYDRTGWAHYLISNHGSGETYYNYVIGLPFWGSPIYKRQEGNSDSRSDWHKFHTTETITYGTSSLVLGTAVLPDGHIYLQYE